MSVSLWQRCAKLLEEEYPPLLFNTWLRPLQAKYQDNHLVLLAPNKFIVEWIKQNFFTRIRELVMQLAGDQVSSVTIAIGSSEPVITPATAPAATGIDSNITSPTAMKIISRCI